MPVIVTAAEADVDAAREAVLYREAFDVITKPIQHTEALASIRVALCQHGSFDCSRNRPALDGGQPRWSPWLSGN